jgi:hypothetical protein
MPKRRAFALLSDLEFAFVEFDSRDGHPYPGGESELGWGNVRSSTRLDYAKGFNDFTDILPEGKFPPRSQFLIFCALQVYGRAAAELWSRVREHYCKDKPRGARPAKDEALDVWYALDAWLQSWLYNLSSCRRPPTNHPAEWLRCIGSTDPTPHLRMSHAFVTKLGFSLPANYGSARRELLDIKGVFQRYAIVPTGSEVPNIGPLMNRFPLIGWDIWQRAAYLLTNDVKPPSHSPIFGWREHRVLDYQRQGRLLHSPEMERAGLGRSWSLHGLLWPQQLETLRKMAGPVRVSGPPVSSGRMLRRMLQ